jgi:hypothetical protein
MMVPVTMVVMRAAFLASMVAVVGCDVGEVPIGGGATVDGGGSGDPQAAAMYTAMVVPIVGAAGKNCTQAACHAVQPPIMDSFDSLTSNGANTTYARKPATSNKLFTGPVTIDTVTGTHPTGNPLAVPYLDATEKATIQMWIDMYGI